MSLDFLRVDWVALGAIFTALSAIATACAAFAAFKAAKAAKASIDTVWDLDEIHRKRRANAIAGPLLREIIELERTMIPFFATRRTGLGARELWQIMAICHEKLEAPLLSRFADRFDDFDVITAGRLGSLLASFATLRGPWEDTRLKLPDDVPEQLLSSTFESRAQALDTLARRTYLATKSLSEYSANDEELDDPGSPGHAFSEIEKYGQQVADELKKELPIAEVPAPKVDAEGAFSVHPPPRKNDPDFSGATKGTEALCFSNR